MNEMFEILDGYDFVHWNCLSPAEDDEPYNVINCYIWTTEQNPSGVQVVLYIFSKQ